MTRTNWLALVAVFVATLVVSYGTVVLVVGAGGPGPRAHWLTHVFVLVATLALVARGRAVKRMVAGEESSMTPIGASRVLVFAKASAVVGAIIAGYFTAILVWVVALPAAPVRDSAFTSGVVGVVLSAAMVAAGLVVEAWCSVDPPSDDEDGPRSPHGFAGA